MSFAKNMGKNIGENISKSLSGKCSLKLLDLAKQSATDVFKTPSKREIREKSETTGDLIGDKIAIKMRKSFKKFTTK